MFSRIRPFVAPVYLFVCLVLGGSAQGIWQNMILQLLGLAIIVRAAMDPGEEPIPTHAKQLLFLVLLAIAMIGLQMVPLPRGVWTHLGPRVRVAQEFASLGMVVAQEPLSLTPAAGLSSLLAIIPPLAMLCAMLRLKAYRPTWLALSLVAGTLAGIALGAMQVASSGGGDSPLYLYAETSTGRAVGFFANSDHMATLLVLTIPFLAAIMAAARTASRQKYFAIVAIAVGTGVVVMVGLALNGSLAGYGLALPVFAASILVVLSPGTRLSLWIAAATVLLLAGSVTALETTAIGSGRIGAHATSAVDSRADILQTTLHATKDFMPFGSGLGSFSSVYPLYEKSEQVTSDYVVHAHNDYAEVALELGVAGIGLIVLFLAWWILQFWRAWHTVEAGPFARAATVASAAVLVHSAVDFPLRTAAIAACFGMCLALLADSRGTPPKERSELRRVRHITI